MKNPANKRNNVLLYVAILAVSMMVLGGGGVAFLNSQAFGSEDKAESQVLCSVTDLEKFGNVTELRAVSLPSGKHVFIFNVKNTAGKNSLTFVNEKKAGDPCSGFDVISENVVPLVAEESVFSIENATFIPYEPTKEDTQEGTIAVWVTEYVNGQEFGSVATFSFAQGELTQEQLNKSNFGDSYGTSIPYAQFVYENDSVHVLVTNLASSGMKLVKYELLSDGDLDTTNPKFCKLVTSSEKNTTCDWVSTFAEGSQMIKKLGNEQLVLGADSAIFLNLVNKGTSIMAYDIAGASGFWNPGLTIQNCSNKKCGSIIQYSESATTYENTEAAVKLINFRYLMFNQSVGSVELVDARINDFTVQDAVSFKVPQLITSVMAKIKDDEEKPAKKQANKKAKEDKEEAKDNKRVNCVSGRTCRTGTNANSVTLGNRPGYVSVRIVVKNNGDKYETRTQLPDNSKRDSDLNIVLCKLRKNCVPTQFKRTYVNVQVITPVIRLTNSPATNKIVTAIRNSVIVYQLCQKEKSTAKSQRTGTEIICIGETPNLR